MRRLLVILISGVVLLPGSSGARGQPLETPNQALEPAQPLKLGGSLDFDLPKPPVESPRYPALRGTVVLYSIFVDGPDSAWSAEDEAEVNRSLDDALALLRRRAREHDVELAWVRDRTAVTLDREVPAASERYSEWTDDAVAATGEEPSELAARLRHAHGADHVVVLLHIMPAGRSYCVPWLRPPRVVMTRRYLVDFSPRERAAGVRVPLFERPIAYAHEILHAFGAEDLYQPDERRAVAEKLYPDDVMLGETARDDFAVGPCTAYRIGWADAPDPETCP